MKKLLGIWLLLAALTALPAVSVFAYEEDIKVDGRLKSMPGKELLELGGEYERKGLPDSALLCMTILANRRYSKATDRDSMGIACCANALYHIGLIYECYYSNYPKAYSYYRTAEHYALARGFHRIIPAIHNGMTGLRRAEISVYGKSDSTIVLLRDYRKAFHEAEEYRVYGLLGVIAKNMAAVAKNLHLVDSVKADLLRYSDMQCDSAEFLAYDNRSYCRAIVEYECNNNVDLALQLLDEALVRESPVGKWEDCNDSVVTLVTRVQLLVEAGRGTEALQVIDRIVEMSKRIDNHVTLFNMYTYLYNYYNVLGYDGKAKEYELLCLKEKNHILFSSKMADVNEMRFLYDIERLNDAAREQASRERLKTYMMYWVGFVALMLMGMLIWIFRKYQQTQEKNLQLYQKNIELLAAHAEEVKRLEQTMAESRAKPRAKYEKNPMDEEGRQDLMHRVFLIMEKSEEVFRPNFTLDRLAELVDANPTYVSYVINEKRQCNFNVLLNEYRIKEACRRLNDREHYGHLTIEGIAASVGIKSRTNFATNFKKFTGLTPSEYQRIAARNAADSNCDINLPASNFGHN